MSLKTKLSRMRNHLVHESVSSNSPQLDNNKMNILHLKEWESFQTKPYFYDGEYIFVREVIYPLQTIHGHYELGHLHDVIVEWNKTNIDHPLSASGFQSSDLFFFDTETTGLGGGTGNTIFLLGFARVLKDKVVLKQLFLPSPSAEVALYDYFLKEIDYTTLVTYNGKAFDWPQVKTRHTMIRELVPKLPKFGHFDLLHASRRLWKKEYNSLKLSIVEKEILNISREDDIPGFMAPMIYFQYIEDQDPEGIFGIMKHNEIDILTLITLYTHISKKVLLEKDSKSSEKYEVARWLHTLGENKIAMKAFQELASSGGDEEKWLARMAVATQFKRDKNYSDAVPLWIEMSANEQAQISIRTEAATELAKFYEHKEKDIVKAIEATELAYNLWKSDSVRRIIRYENEDQFKKRLERLSKKLRNN